MQDKPNLIKIDACIAKASITRNHFYTLIRKGLMPRPVKLGRASRWYEHEVDAAIAALAACRVVVSA